MMTLNEFMVQLECSVAKKPASKEAIVAAEKALGVRFAKEYKAFLEEYGYACFEGHSLNGISDQVYLDVVAVTKEVREVLKDLDASLYVVEDLHGDFLYIVQNENGDVFEVGLNRKMNKIASSLVEYLNQ